MNLQPAFDLDAYCVKFQPKPPSGQVQCIIHGYGEWRQVNGKQARETVCVIGEWSASVDQAFDSAMVELRKVVVSISSGLDLGDLLS